MIYTRTFWVDNETLVNAARMNNIEEGILNLLSNKLELSSIKKGNGISLSFGTDNSITISTDSEYIDSKLATLSGQFNTSLSQKTNTGGSTKTTKEIELQVNELGDSISGLSEMSTVAEFTTYSAMAATVNPISDITGTALVKGQLVLVTSDTNTTKNGIYRFKGLTTGNVGIYSFVGALGNLTTYLQKGGFNGTAEDLNSEIKTTKTTADKAVPSESTKETKVKDNSGTLFVTDAVGRVIGSISAEGFKAFAISIIDPATKEVLDVIDKDFLERIPFGMSSSELDKRVPKKSSSESSIRDGSDSYKITDSVGNVIAVVSKDGIKTYAMEIVDPVTKQVIASIDKDWFTQFESSLDSIEADLLSRIPAKNTKQTLLRDPSDTLFITDVNGKIIGQIDVDGFKSLSYAVIDPANKEIIASLDKDWIEALMARLTSAESGAFLSDFRLAYKKDSLFITDQAGRVICYINKDGITSIGYIDADGNPITGGASKKLKDKFVVSLGDSHIRASWLTKFCDDTGAKFDDTLELQLLNAQYSYPDTALMLGQARELRAYCNANPAKIPDLILIENCHFKTSDNAKISDYVPQIYENFYEYGTVYGSSSAFMSNVNSDRAAFVASLTPKLRTALRFKFSSFKDTLTFSATTVSAGTVVLTIDGVQFSITVAAGQTLSQVITALNDWAFNEGTSWSNAATKGTTRVNTIELVYTGNNTNPGEPTLAFNGGTKQV